MPLDDIEASLIADNTKTIAGRPASESADAFAIHRNMAAAVFQHWEERHDRRSDAADRQMARLDHLGNQLSEVGNTIVVAGAKNLLEGDPVEALSLKQMFTADATADKLMNTLFALQGGSLGVKTVAITPPETGQIPTYVSNLLMAALAAQLATQAQAATKAD